MAVFCPRCEKRHPSEALVGGATLLCDCGAHLGAAPRTNARAFQRILSSRADSLCRMILSSDCDEVEVAMERGRVRALAETLFPDRMDLYDMIFESRFDRLWQQWRGA